MSVTEQTDVAVMLIANARRDRRELARSVHERSSRRNGPWVALSAGALSLADLRSALDLAGGGTLYLDDLHQLHPSAQCYLLGWFDERAAGGCIDGSTPAARLVTGATRSFVDDVAAHDFSERLFYRLNTVLISGAHGAAA